MAEHEIKSDEFKTSGIPPKGVRPSHSSVETSVMGVERRGRRSSNLILNSRSIHRDGTGGRRRWKGQPFQDRWVRISLRAQRNPASAFNNLLHHINVETLKEAHDELDGTKASGVDGITKSEYGKNLKPNLENLARRIQRGGYGPKPKREVLIPKANGKTRPIAVACFEDKLVDAVIAKILNSVYDNGFIPDSFGFRPMKSAEGAIKTCHGTLRNGKYPFVVEVDFSNFSNFFNEIPHDRLLEILGEKLADERLLRLITRFLKGKTVKRDGTVVSDTRGTPQGGVMSPILANIYLDTVLDKWFAENYKTGKMVRYADDAVFFFREEEQAKSFLEDFKSRVESYGLIVNEEKSGFLSFRKTERSQFSFLGFTFYWNTRSRRTLLKVKTEKKRLHRAMTEFYHWIKADRNKVKLSVLLKLANAKLRGHYNYFGFWMNRPKLVHFYSEAVKAMFKWLNRRGQKRSYTWDGFRELLKQKLLIPPPKVGKLKQIGWSFGNV